MFDVFAPAPKDLRKARLEEYHQYLVERDGELISTEVAISPRSDDDEVRDSSDDDSRHARKGYHTRILLSASNRYGIACTQA
jgi:hypothetical protein